MIAAIARRSVEFPFLHRWERARYSPAYLRSGPSEEEVQAAVVQALQYRWRAKVTVIDVGNKRLRGRLLRAGANRQILVSCGGDGRGIVDLAVTFPGGRAGWFEVKKPEICVVSQATGLLVRKREPGEPTQEQLAFLLDQASIGAVVGVLWSPLDLESCIPGCA